MTGHAASNRHLQAARDLGQGQLGAAGRATHQHAPPDRDQGIVLSSTPELEAAGGSLRRVDGVPGPPQGFISERSLE